MTSKTYAARGLLDFRMALKVQGATIRICFSGGTMSTNGVISAKYTTDNEAIQKLIEQSPHFKSDRVYLFSTVSKEEEKAKAVVEKKENENSEAETAENPQEETDENSAD